eukprot:scaffold240083_cov15-Tisochrysis_lutea.AAC.1
MGRKVADAVASNTGLIQMGNRLRVTPAVAATLAAKAKEAGHQLSATSDGGPRRHRRHICEANPSCHFQPCTCEFTSPDRQARELLNADPSESWMNY